MFTYKIFAPSSKLFKPLSEKIPRITLDVMKKNMLLGLREARKNVSGGGNAKDRLNVRSGALRQSITKAVFQRGKVTHGLLGSNIAYARIHEYGGTIKPKTRQYLTIPINHGKKSYSGYTKAGVQRWKAGDWGFAQTFVKRSKSGKLFIWGKVGQGKIVPLFRLVKQVKIPKRPYLTPALEKIKPRVMAEIGLRIAKGE